MKCWYCKTYLGEPHYHGQPAPVLLHCTNCPIEVEYNFGSGSIVGRVTMLLSINDKNYAVEMNYLRKDKIKFGLYYINGNLWYPVVESDSIPNITPTNLKEKVRTYLIFS